MSTNTDVFRGRPVWKIAGGAIALAAMACLFWPTGPTPNTEDPAGPSGAPPPTFRDARFLPVPSSLPPVPVQVDNVMKTWRWAVTTKQAEPVLECNRLFLGQPEKYGPALVDAANGDQHGRVRAFSTRVLGRLKNPAYAQVFEDLLADESQFVRQNAAWALGQLGKPEYVAVLRRVRRHDRADNVRDAAARAIDQLSGADREDLQQKR